MAEVQGEFDLRLAVECADAFSEASGLGCTVSDSYGKPLYHTGYSCESCGYCNAAGGNREGCVQAHIYGMTEAERFGGKYIYFCPMGLTCFVSPILGQHGSRAKITAGPFLMVEREDFVGLEIDGLLTGIQREKAVLELSKIPVVSTKKVNALSVLLFMAVGFMNNVSNSSRMLEIQSSDEIQGQISEYIFQLKGGEQLPRYPIETERRLLRCITESNKEEAGKLLNALLGHIFFSSGGDFNTIRSSVYELLVLISRAAISGGADSERTIKLSRKYLSESGGVKNLDELCAWLTGAMNRLIDSIFVFENIKHKDVIHGAIHYMREHCQEKLTLEETARAVFLSSPYFSKIFKAETGEGWSGYLSRLRVEKSKALLLSSQIRLSDIAALVGFEDQSYFTKVFKKVTGVSPNQFRDKNGQL